MKQFSALMLVLALAGSACHAPVTLTTPQGVTAWKADQIVVRVNELMNAAIAAEAGGGLPRTAARTLVAFCVDADKTLAATPAGWQQTLAAAWAQTKARVSMPANPAVSAAMGAVDAILAIQGAN